ncbi:glycine-rich protein 5-like [Trifolium pratense]|uniref:glycine-rich protein 5-like n=1 Tax=Trifolium pratense TaxID=57577 RepID=UPI001E691307|nr:glycine-rich protein 5-like [Trifolium pratense]
MDDGCPCTTCTVSHASDNNTAVVLLITSTSFSLRNAHDKQIATNLRQKLGGFTSGGFGGGGGVVSGSSGAALKLTVGGFGGNSSGGGFGDGRGVGGFVDGGGLEGGHKVVYKNTTYI